MSPRCVVSNTGPLLHLSEAGALDLLPLTGSIHVPAGVEAELVRWVPDWSAPEWLTVDMLQERPATEANAWREAGLLDAGEAAALALARQLSADWFLTDDAAARLLAGTLGLEVHGSLGVVLWAAAAGHFDHADARSVLDRLTQSSLWLSARVLTEARDSLDRLFPQQ